MKNIKGKHCANCYNCRSKSGRAWCGLYKWEIMSTVDFRILTSGHYKDKATQCPEYQSMEG